MKSYSQENAIIQRDVEVVRVPSGEKTVLYEGTEVVITQALGGTFTVMTMQGIMASVQGQDADALGKEVPREIAQFEKDKKTKSTDELVIAALKTCYDPEIPYNIVDLGLVYHCDVIPLKDGYHKVEVRMTLTAPGCGMGDYIASDVRKKLLSIPSVTEAEVELVFDPPWDQSKVSPAIRRELM